MYRDPDLSAVIVRRISNPLQSSPPTMIKRKLSFNEDPFYFQSTFQKSSFDNKEIPSKKIKLSDSDYVVVERGMSSNKKSIPDLYSMLLNDARKFEERANITDSVLINTLVKAIFKYILHELSNGFGQSSEFDPSLNFFRTFAVKYNDKITDLEGVRWIWTIDESEGLWLTTCKKVFRDFSTKFFSNEKIILKWVGNKLIREVIQKIYTKYRDIFEKILSAPDLFYQLAPLLNTVRS